MNPFSLKPVLLALALAIGHLTAAGAVEKAAMDTVPKQSAGRDSESSWKNVPTQAIGAGDVRFAYRELGKHHGGTPVVFLTHLAAVLDNWDPRIVDGMAASHHIVAFDNRGVGASSGSPSNSIEAMASDAIAFIQAMGFEQVDLVGFSMGGMIAQEIVLQQPQRVRRMILAGTGPAGGEGISKVAGVANYDLLQGLFSSQDPKQFLFFTRTTNGIEAGQAFLARLAERTDNRDKEISPTAYMAQLWALYAWGQKPPADLSAVQQPVLVVNGDDDRMVPTANTYDLARRLPHSELVIYPDAGHGALFQFHEDFVLKSLRFLQ